MRLSPLFLICLLLIVSACSSRQAPAPVPPPIVSAPSAPQSPDQPRKRPPATSRPYTVLGQTYHPLLDGRGFREEGTASWYGPDFDGKPTASGEMYNMHALTAAHRILPMHTQVRVTNLENGRTVVLRVNDRGPFVNNRIIDLSFAGASQLDMVGPGTARVRVESLQTWGDDIPGIFYVQTGSYSLEQNALRSLSALRSAGYGQSRTVPVVINGVRFWRVQAGAFQGYNSATQTRQRLAQAFPDCFIVAD